MRLGKYFTLDEMIRSSTASRLGIDNSPNSEQLRNLAALVENVLDPLREAVGRPIVVSSGFRGPRVNSAVGGVSTSQHALGQAADISVKGMRPIQIIQIAQEFGLPFDQIIDEFDSWVHVSFGPRHRRQTLKARRNSAGRTVYSPL